MRMNRNKLPMKYALEIYQELPGYPSHQDLEYVLVTTLQDKDLLGKPFTAEQIWDGMKPVQGSMATLIGFLDNLCQPDNPADEFQVKGSKPSSNSYLINMHPWMN